MLLRCPWTVALLLGRTLNTIRVSHAAVAADTGHKVVGPSLPLTLSGITMTEYQENDDMSMATYWVSGSDAAITWSLSGDDSDDFSIDKNMWQNGVLRFTSPPNYENPTDADTDNLYRVTIQASDGTNVSTLQIVVLVRNVWLDADEVPVISGTVRVGEDADGGHVPYIGHILFGPLVLVDKKRRDHGHGD